MNIFDIHRVNLSCYISLKIDRDLHFSHVFTQCICLTICGFTRAPSLMEYLTAAGNFSFQSSAFVDRGRGVVSQRCLFPACQCTCEAAVTTERPAEA